MLWCLLNAEPWPWFGLLLLLKLLPIAQSPVDVASKQVRRLSSPCRSTMLEVLSELPYKNGTLL